MLPKPKTVVVDKTKSESVVTESMNYLALVTYQSFIEQQKVSSKLTLLVEEIGSLISFFRNKDQREEEKDEIRELREPKKQETSSLETIGDVIGFLGISATVAGIAALITALEKSISEPIRDVVATMALFGKEIRGMITAIPKLIKWISTLTKDLLRILHWEGAYALIRAIAKLDKYLAAIENLFSGTQIVKVLSNILEVGKTFFRSFNTIAELFGKITSFISRPLISIIEKAINFGGTMLKFASKWISKLFVPLQVIFSVIDFVNGAIEGYERGGIKEALANGLTEVFNGLVISVIDILSDITGWILSKIGLTSTSEKLNTATEEMTAAATKTFRAIVDTFISLFTLDFEGVWTNLKTGFGSLKELVIASIRGTLNFVIGIFQDIFSLDGSGDIDSLMNYLVSGIKDFFEEIIAMLKSAARSTLSYLPGGERVANKILGPKTITENDIMEEAQRIAKDKAYDTLSLKDKTLIHFGDHELVTKATETDMKEAIVELLERGYELPNSLTGIDQQNEKITDLLRKQGGGNTNNYIDNSTTVVGGSRGSSPQVLIVPRTEKASPSSPMRRGGSGGGGF